MHDIWIVRREALWVLANLSTKGVPSQVTKIYKKNVLLPLTKALGISAFDTSLLLKLLDACHRMLGIVDDILGDAKSYFEEYDGIEYLEKLQEHKNPTVNEKVIMMIDQFFPLDDEEEENMMMPDSKSCNSTEFMFEMKHKRLLLPSPSPTNNTSVPMPKSLLGHSNSNVSL